MDTSAMALQIVMLKRGLTVGMNEAKIVTWALKPGFMKFKVQQRRRMQSVQKLHRALLGSTKPNHQPILLTECVGVVME
jgi:hypothetical protein